MKESKTRPQIIAIGLEPFSEGETFGKWPLHVTVLPWFRGAHQKRLVRALHEIADKQNPLAIHIGKHDMFGEGDIPVRLVQPADGFPELHLATLAAVTNSGGQCENLGIIGYKYKPHVTTLYNEEPESGIVVSSMALISPNPASYKRVEQVFEFHG